MVAGGNPEYNALRKALRLRYIALAGHGHRKKGHTLFDQCNHATFKMEHDNVRVHGCLYASSIGSSSHLSVTVPNDEEMRTFRRLLSRDVGWHVQIGDEDTQFSVKGTRDVRIVLTDLVEIVPRYVVLMAFGRKWAAKRVVRALRSTRVE
jgi:hypothetical protein